MQEFFNHTLTQLILNPFPNDTINMVSMGFYLVVLSLIITAMIEIRKS